jgi:hypothetical protein
MSFSVVYLCAREIVELLLYVYISYVPSIPWAQKFIKTTYVILNIMTSMFQFNLLNEIAYVVNLQG